MSDGVHLATDIYLPAGDGPFPVVFSRTPYGRVKANEGAVKLARRYGKLKLDGAYEIITTNESFHGRTLATTAATGPCCATNRGI